MLILSQKKVFFSIYYIRKEVYDEREKILYFFSFLFINMRHKKNKIIESIRFFWERVLSLPFGRRLIFFSALFTMGFLFFPWFSDDQIVYNTFGKSPLFGTLLFLIAIFVLLLILREIFSQSGRLGIFSHSILYLFLFGQGLYTVILANSALSMLMLESTLYETRMGMMLTFLSLGIGLAGAVFSRNFSPESTNKKQVFVDKNIDLSDSSMKPEHQLSLGDYEDK